MYSYLGPSGAGKSMVLNLLGGMDHATSGVSFSEKVALFIEGKFN